MQVSFRVPQTSDYLEWVNDSGTWRITHADPSVFWLPEESQTVLIGPYGLRLTSDNLLEAVYEIPRPTHLEVHEVGDTGLTFQDPETEEWLMVDLETGEGVLHDGEPAVFEPIDEQTLEFRPGRFLNEAAEWVADDQASRWRAEEIMTEEERQLAQLGRDLALFLASREDHTELLDEAEIALFDPLKPGFWRYESNAQWALGNHLFTDYEHAYTMESRGTDSFRLRSDLSNNGVDLRFARIVEYPTARGPLRNAPVMLVAMGNSGRPSLNAGLALLTVPIALQAAFLDQNEQYKAGCCMRRFVQSVSSRVCTGFLPFGFSESTCDDFMTKNWCALGAATPVNRQADCACYQDVPVHEGLEYTLFNALNDALWLEVGRQCIIPECMSGRGYRDFKMREFENCPSLCLNVQELVATGDYSEIINEGDQYLACADGFIDLGDIHSGDPPEDCRGPYDQEGVNIETACQGSSIPHGQTCAPVSCQDAARNPEGQVICDNGTYKGAITGCTDATSPIPPPGETPLLADYPDNQRLAIILWSVAGGSFLALMLIVWLGLRGHGSASKGSTGSTGSKGSKAWYALPVLIALGLAAGGAYLWWGVDEEEEVSLRIAETMDTNPGNLRTATPAEKDELRPWLEAPGSINCSGASMGVVTNSTWSCAPFFY